MVADVFCSLDKFLLVVIFHDFLSIYGKTEKTEFIN